MWLKFILKNSDTFKRLGSSVLFLSALYFIEKPTITVTLLFTGEKSKMFLIKLYYHPEWPVLLKVPVV